MYNPPNMLAMRVPSAAAPCYFLPNTRGSQAKKLPAQQGWDRPPQQISQRMRKSFKKANTSIISNRTAINSVPAKMTKVPAIMKSINLLENKWNNQSSVDYIKNFEKPKIFFVFLPRFSSMSPSNIKAGSQLLTNSQKTFFLFLPV